MSAPATTPAGSEHTVVADALPTSFGVFKPVGHLMVGLPTQAQTDGLVSALQGAGWPSAEVQQFTPRDSVQELEGLVEQAGAMAGFGYEITLLRRYLALAQQGQCWLLVKVDSTDAAARAAELARSHGATLAVHYRLLTVEELI
jgi:hypothetical protein